MFLMMKIYDHIHSNYVNSKGASMSNSFLLIVWFTISKWTGRFTAPALYLVSVELNLTFSNNLWGLGSIAFSSTHFYELKNGRH
jgi:hypothetical protein